MRLISLIFLLYLSVIPQSLGGTIDSLLRELENVNLADKNQLYDVHSKLGDEYNSRQEENYKLSAHHHSIALNIAKEQKDKAKMAKCLYGIGVSNQRRNNFKEALENFNAILELGFEKNDDQRAKAFTQISSIYQALGDYQRSFENQMEALLINELNGNLVGICNSNYNLGTIFYYQNQLDQSLKHYQKAMDIVVELQNEQFLYSCNAALGSVYQKLKDYPQSLKYNQQSLALAEKQQYKTGIAYAKGNIAMNYLAQGDFKKAEKFVLESIDIKRELGDKYGIIGSGIDLSRLYVEWDQPERAIPILENALTLAIDVDSKTRRSEIYHALSEVYDQVNRPKESHIYLKKYVALKDSVLNEKTLEEMGQSQKRYEVQKKEHEIELLMKENQILERDKEIQELQVYIFAIIIIAFLLFIWWFRKRLKYQRRTNKLLEEKNEEINVQNIELQHAQDQLVQANILLEDNNLLLEEKNDLLEEKNEEIKIKNKQLEYSNEDLQQFAYVASHDLKEPLRMIDSYTKLLVKRYNDLFDESGKEFMFFVTDAVSRMKILLDDLLDFSRAGNLEAPSEAISLNNVLTLVEANLRHQFETLNAKLIIKSENLPFVKAHRTQLLQLLQNLISNGAKFKGERDPIVEVDCEKRENDFVISVKDNGIGISEENKKKVFEMFKRLHTREEYEGTGIGLATCKRIVSTWGGDIWVESETGVGSTFYFSIPKSAVDESPNNIKSALMN